MHTFRSTLTLAVLLTVPSAVQAQTARPVQPPNHSPGPVTGVVASSRPFTVTGTFSDGTTADMFVVEVTTARDAGSGMATGRDASSGLASGKRQYQPLIIRKSLDKSTPLLWRAMSSGERLRYIKIEFDNKRTIQLHEVTVTRVSTVSGRTDMEELLVSFASVTVDGTVPKTMAFDDWKRDSR